MTSGEPQLEFVVPPSGGWVQKPPEGGTTNGNYKRLQTTMIGLKSYEPDDCAFTDSFSTWSDDDGEC